jgi:hypothetical protein
MDHTLRLFLVMILFGLLGGVVNFIYSHPGKNKKGSGPVVSDLLKSLITGVAASFLVPLFLNMISSNIVRESETDPIKLVVFAGFCVIASASSKAFIRGISNKVLERVNKVEEDVQAVKTELRPVILKHTEIDKTGSGDWDAEDTNNPQPGHGKADQIETSKIKVLETLSNSEYAFRTVNGLARDANMEPELVQECLEDCISSGLAGLIDNGLGTRFYITEDGHAHLLNHDGETEQKKAFSSSEGQHTGQPINHPSGLQQNPGV